MTGAINDVSNNFDESVVISKVILGKYYIRIEKSSYDLQGLLIKVIIRKL